MEIVRMTKLDNAGSGKIAAFFDFKTDDEIVIKGFRIVNGSSGFFVAAPNEKGKDGKYYDSVLLPKEIKDKLDTLALKEYKK